MYKKILVPLDGSELSECSLEHARAIAAGCQVPEMVLLRVVEPLSAQTVAVLAEAGHDLLRRAELDNQSEAAEYMAGMKKKLAGDGMKVETVIVDGHAADEILDYTRKNKVDLIVITTHGKSGISEWVFGSVAHKVLQHSPVPVLMIAPPGCRVKS